MKATFKESEPEITLVSGSVWIVAGNHIPCVLSETAYCAWTLYAAATMLRHQISEADMKAYLRNRDARCVYTPDNPQQPTEPEEPVLEHWSTWESGGVYLFLTKSKREYGWELSDPSGPIVSGGDEWMRDYLMDVGYHRVYGTWTIECGRKGKNQ